MERIKTYFLGVTVILLTACTGAEGSIPTQQEPVQHEEGFAACRVDRDCLLPQDYQESQGCAFGAVCWEGSCHAACPVVGLESQRPEGDICSDNADCDCSVRGDKTQECICFHGSCLSVEDQF